MAAPAQVHIHGADDSLHTIADEANLDVEDFKIKVTRETLDRKNRNGALVRREYRNPLTAISFTAFIITSAGLASQHPGTRVISLANFAVEKRGMDPAVGTMMLDDAEDSLSMTEDLKTSMNITHAPFVVTE
jgi:hypothetical protein